MVLYTESDAQYAIEVASRVAAQKAVDIAVPAAVDIALSDYGKKRDAELWWWKLGTGAGIAAGVIGLVVAALK